MAFQAHCFFRSNPWTSGQGGAPPYAAVVLLLETIERSLQRAGMKPVNLCCEAWRVPDRPDGMDQLALISIDGEPGEIHAPLRSWYQWQHPRWDYSRAPRPALEPIAVLE